MSSGLNAARMNIEKQNDIRVPEEHGLMASAAACSSADSSLAFSDCCSRLKSLQPEVRPLHAPRPSLHPLKIRWPLLTSVVLALLLTSFCFPNRWRPTQNGTDPRRLAGNGHKESDDVDGHDPADFTQLCLALGSWSPPEASPGNPRLSPLLVEAFLASLEEGIASDLLPNEAPFSAGQQPSDYPSLPVPGEKAKRYCVDTPEEDGEFAASSSKVARTSASSCVTMSLVTHPSPPAVESAEGCSQDLHADGEAAPQVAHASSSQPLSVQQHPAVEKSPSQAPPPAGQEAPAGVFASSSGECKGQKNGAAVASQTSGVLDVLAKLNEEEIAKHPYVHIPALRQGVQPRRFSLNNMMSPDQCPRRHVNVLRKVRQLLLRPTLNQADADLLVNLSEKLASHAVHMMASDISFLRPYAAAEQMGRRFMLFNALYSASLALGASWSLEPWWELLASKMTTDYLYYAEFRANVNKFNVALTDDLMEALRLYKLGMSPTNADIISLKFRLFCKPQSPYFLRDASWRPWREDGESAQETGRVSEQLGRCSNGLHATECLGASVLRSRRSEPHERRMQQLNSQAVLSPRETASSA
ncbi:hypothetical protein Efla_007295 [Eimeria flavescens]